MSFAIPDFQPPEAAAIGMLTASLLAGDSRETGSSDPGSINFSPALASRPDNGLDQHDGPTLHNQRVAPVEIQTEKPIHLLAAYMVANNVPREEIAARLGVTKQSIGNWMAQRWFITRVCGIIKEAGETDIVQKIVNLEAVNNVCTLVALRDDPKAPASVRFQSAVHLWERYSGKTTEPLKRDGAASSDPVEENKRLLNEIHLLEQKEKKIYGSNATTNPLN
jgi:hypothetical protein